MIDFVIADQLFYAEVYGRIFWATTPAGLNELINSFGQRIPYEKRAWFYEIRTSFNPMEC